MRGCEQEAADRGPLAWPLPVQRLTLLVCGLPRDLGEQCIRQGGRLTDPGDTFSNVKPSWARLQVHAREVALTPGCLCACARRNFRSRVDCLAALIRKCDHPALEDG